MTPCKIVLTAPDYLPASKYPQNQKLSVCTPQATAREKNKGKQSLAVSVWERRCSLAGVET